MKTDGSSDEGKGRLALISSPAQGANYEVSVLFSRKNINDLNLMGEFKRMAAKFEPLKRKAVAAQKEIASELAKVPKTKVYKELCVGNPELSPKNLAP